jgi:hypothetical protein
MRTDRFNQHYEMTAWGYAPTYASAERCRLDDEDSARVFIYGLQLEPHRWAQLLLGLRIEIADFDWTGISKPR